MRRHGFGLVEVLVALALTGVLLVALLAYVRSARNAQVAGESAGEATQTLLLAAELLREELLRAGSGPWPLPISSQEVEGLGHDLTPAQFLGRGVQVRSVPGGQAVRIVYIDDSLAGGPVARDFTFEAGSDGQGQPQLYRRSGTGSRQPWVAGVESLRIAGVIDGDGSSLGWQQAAGGELRALWLELQAAGEERRVLLELPHRPRLAAP